VLPRLGGRVCGAAAAAAAGPGLSVCCHVTAGPPGPALQPSMMSRVCERVGVCGVSAGAVQGRRGGVARVAEGAARQTGSASRVGHPGRTQTKGRSTGRRSSAGRAAQRGVGRTSSVWTPAPHLSCRRCSV
jgi:hypothetical protein